MPARRRCLTAAVTAVLLTGLTGCGGDDPAPEADPSAAASSPATSPDDSPAASADPSDPAEGQLAGEGYTFALPPGWEDATEQFKKYSALIDTGAVDATQAGQGFRDNLNVLRNAARTALPSEQAERRFVAELRTVASGVRVEPEGSLDGVAALHLSGRTRTGQVTASTDQYLCHVDGAYYIVTFSFGTGTPEPTREQEVAAVLDSWTWD